MMGTLYQDLRLGIRTLSKDLGFAVVVVLTLGLGIGVNTSVFSIVNTVLLRPLPFKNPSQLVMVWENNHQKGWNESGVASAKYRDWEARNRVFTGMAAYSAAGRNLTVGGESERVEAAHVSRSFFSLLGVSPSLGRAFLPEEDTAEPKLVILGHSLWERRFASDRNVLGRTVTLDEESFTVVGVMPSGFDFPEGTHVWELWGSRSVGNRLSHGWSVMARLKPSISIAQAQTEMSGIARSLEREYADTDAGWGVTVRSLSDALIGGVRRAILILMGAVACVLLIACANVTNLVLARATTRQKEMAIRSALGAGRIRLVRQLLSESFLLAALGGGLGVGIAFWGSKLVVLLSAAHVPRLKELQVDGPVLIFATIVTVITGILCGLPPALQLSTPDINTFLKEGGKSSGAGAGGHQLRHLLVVLEVSLTIVLLCGAGLLIRTLEKLVHVNPGFNPENVLTIRLRMPYAKYNRGEDTRAFYRRLLERVSGLPGVQSVGTVSELPLGGRAETFRFVFEGGAAPSLAEMPTTEFRVVSPDYFRAMGIPLKNGREFTELDNGAGARSVLINESMARHFWPGEDPIGKRISIEPDKGLWLSIVGVVGDVRQFRLDAEAKPEMYVPYTYEAPWWITLVVRTSSSPQKMIPAVVSQVKALDKEVPPFDIKALDQYISDSLAQRRFAMVLLGAFAGFGVVLATIGIYGVMSYSVGRRTHEFGIRMALGAEPSCVLRLVIGQGLSLTLVGMLLGVVGAVGLTRALSSLLFGVSPTDPITFTAVSILLVGVAILASYFPARRATKVDPMEALRYE